MFCMVYLLLYDAADIMLYLLSESSLFYVYAVGKQPIINEWYKMVLDGRGELWMMGWNLLRSYFRCVITLCLIMFVMFNYRMRLCFISCYDRWMFYFALCKKKNFTPFLCLCYECMLLLRARASRGVTEIGIRATGSPVTHSQSACHRHHHCKLLFCFISVIAF